jgi:hypothetical protein
MRVADHLTDLLDGIPGPAAGRRPAATGPIRAQCHLRVAFANGFANIMFFHQ